MSGELPPERGKPFPPRPGAPRPPAPPPAALLHRDESPLMEYMRQRMEAMERQLHAERERARASESMLQQQEALRAEVETHLRRISEQLRQEKQVRDLEDERTAGRGRVDALERRLDEMHSAFAALLKEAMANQGERGMAAYAELESVKASLSAVREELGRVREGLEPVRSLRSEVESLRDAVPAASQRRAETDEAFREELRGLAERLGGSLLERLAAMDRRLGEELRDHQDRLAAITRDRDALQQTVEEQYRRARQETLRERAALESQFEDQISQLRASLEASAERQGGAADALSRVEDLSKKVHAILTTPAKAKDAMLADLEAEKRDLMKALRDRTEQLRQYTLERREVEHTLGESLMDLNRRLEAEGAKYRQLQEHAASLEATIEGLRADGRLADEERKREGERFRRLAAERDSIVAALAEEADKARRRIEERAESEKRWEAKVLEMQKTLDEERERRLRAEESVSELRERVHAVTDHMTKALREKERVEREAAAWLKEREAFEGQLRKKDEMIGMLSSTFQNLLKNPEAS